jgi:hypothetical protein
MTLIGIGNMGAVLSAQERMMPPLAVGHHGGTPEATGEAVLRSLDEHHVVLAVDGPNGGVFAVEMESALGGPIHLRSKLCEVYHRAGDSLVIDFEDEGKVYIFALKGGAIVRGHDTVPSGARKLDITLVGDASSLSFHRGGTPINLDDFEAGSMPEGLEAIFGAAGAGGIIPQNPYPDPGGASGSCQSSCRAARHNPIGIIGNDSCSVDCAPPNCAKCAEDNAGVSCYCYAPPPHL